MFKFIAFHPFPDSFIFNEKKVNRKENIIIILPHPVINDILLMVVSE